MNNLFSQTPTDRGLLDHNEQRDLVKKFTERLNKMESKPGNPDGSNKNEKDGNDPKNWNNDSLSIINDEEENSKIKDKSDSGAKNPKINVIKDNANLNFMKSNSNLGAMSPLSPFMPNQRIGHLRFQLTGEYIFLV